MEADGSEISRLPAELLASIVSLTSPPDAGRCAAVSRAFLAAADSDAVWSCFLPRDLPRFAQAVLRCATPSKKGLFRRLSGQPALLPGKLMSMRLDRATGTKCYMLSARARGRRRDQTVSESAAVWKARDTVAARKASAGDVREITCTRRSSGRRSISQAAGASMA